ncbi:hypothetical protein T06_8394 [Trichinella sp. T6]|nr:hypothetical protein T06_8394 [Trichinella sp. T6]
MDTLTSVMKKNLKSLLSPFISKCGKLLENCNNFYIIHR